MAIASLAAMGKVVAVPVAAVAEVAAGKRVYQSSDLMADGRQWQ